MGAKIQKKYNIAAKGILNISNGVVSIEVPDTGELVDLSELFIDFADKDVSVSISYSEDLYE